MSQQVCRFGWNCRRRDCWFLHPEGRQIEQTNGGLAAHTTMSNLNVSTLSGTPFNRASLNGAAARVSSPLANTPTYPQSPPQSQSTQTQSHSESSQGSSRLQEGDIRGWTATTKSSASESVGGPVSGSVSGSSKKICNFGRQCRRQQCWYEHPQGREVDDVLSLEDRLAALCVSGGSVSERAEAEAELIQEAFESSQDWFPRSADCPCCRGYIYDCGDPTCHSLGVCGCTFAEDSKSRDDLTDTIIDSDNEDDDTWKDIWYSDSRHCPCCNGYVYKCHNVCQRTNDLHCACFPAFQTLN